MPGEDLERTHWASTGIVFGGMSRAESAAAMVADAFHQVASLDRLRAAYAAPRWDWDQHAFTSCLITQLCATLDDGRYLNFGFRRKMKFGCQSSVVRRDWNFLGNAGRKHQGSFILTEVLAAFLTKFQFRLTTKLDDHYMVAGFRAYMAGTNSPLAAPAQTAGNGQVLFGRIKAPDSASPSASQADVGYIVFFGMKQFGKDEGGDTPVDDSVRSARQTMQQVVASLRGVKGLVIDLRYNGGGEDAVALAISGFFADHAVEAYTKRAFNAGKLIDPYKVTVVPEDGERLAVPMVVLTSDMTVNAAEVCVLDLRVLPHSTQLGQPTRGSLSDRLSKVLPNEWKFSLSNEIYTDVHGRVFEVNGIPPDVLTDWPSPKAPDDLRFGRDIFAAVKKLR